MRSSVYFIFALVCATVYGNPQPCSGGPPSEPELPGPILPGPIIVLPIGSSTSANANAVAESASGTIGNLIGTGLSQSESSASAIAAAQSASGTIGNLIGSGLSQSESSASAIAAAQSASGTIGNLIGTGLSQSESSASAIAAAQSASGTIGNLIGTGLSQSESSASAIAVAQSASGTIGNLIGTGLSQSESSASAIAAAQSASGTIGNLIGTGLSQSVSSANAIGAAESASGIIGNLIGTGLSQSGSSASAAASSQSVTYGIAGLLGPVIYGTINGAYSESSAISSSYSTGLLNNLIGYLGNLNTSVNLNIKLLLQTIFGVNGVNINGIGLNLGNILTMFGGLFQPINNSGALQNLINLLSSSTSTSGNIFSQLGYIIKLFVGPIGGSDITLTSEISYALQQLLSGSDGVESLLQESLSAIQSLISETSSSLIINLESYLGTLGATGSFQLLSSALLNGLLGLIIRLIGRIPIRIICLLLSSILLSLIRLFQNLVSILIRLRNALLGSGCNRNFIISIIILLRQLLGRIAVTIISIVGYGGGFNILPQPIPKPCGCHK